MQLIIEPYTYNITYQENQTCIKIHHNNDFLEWSAIVSDVLCDDNCAIKLNITPLMLYRMFETYEYDKNILIKFPNEYTKKYDDLEIIINITLLDDYVNTNKIIFKPLKIPSEIKINKKLAIIDNKIKFINNIIDNVPKSIDIVSNISKHTANLANELKQIINGLLANAKIQTTINNELDINIQSQQKINECTEKINETLLNRIEELSEIIQLHEIKITYYDNCLVAMQEVNQKNINIIENLEKRIDVLERK